MKRIKVMMGVLIFTGFFNKADAQGSMQPMPIATTYSKTTNLIFPYPVQSVDHGSSGIMVQQRKGAGNILHVKAATREFEPTSLSVVTSDGEFYSFIVWYTDDTDELNYVFSGDNKTDLHKVVDAPVFLHRNKKNEQINISLQGIYAGDETVWLKWKCINQSVINFPVSYTKYFIRDRKLLKRRAINEKELSPIYYSGQQLIRAKESETFIVGFNGFHINKKQQLIVQVGGENPAFAY